VMPPEPKTAEEAWNFHVKHIDDSYLSAMLMGQVESTLACLSCSHQSRSWTCIWQLQLQIEPEVTKVHTESAQPTLNKENNQTEPITKGQAILEKNEY